MADRRDRRSVRLRGYDTTPPGVYFVTVYTHQRQPDACAGYAGNEREIDRRGTLDALRKSIRDAGAHLRLVYFRPLTEFNAKRA